MKNVDDLVVLVVKVEGDNGSVRYEAIVEPRDEWSAMSIATASFQVAAALLVAEGSLPKGLVYPEHIAFSDENAVKVMRFIEQWGVTVTERPM